MSRPSAVFRSSNVNTPSTIRQQQHPNKISDPFPMLDIKEIVICLESCSFTCSEELLLKPSQQYMLTLFQQIADSFLNISDKKLYKVLNSIDDNNEYLDTLSIIGLQKIIYKFLNECGIDDFNIMDIIKPDPQRIRRILSCIVNFARFREEHKFLIEDLHLKNEEIVKLYKELSLKIQNLELEINQLSQSNQSSNLQQIEDLNLQLEQELRKLKKNQESITNQHDLYKRDKLQLLKNFENLSYLITEGQKELDKLKLITNESPDLVLQFNKELSTTLSNEQQLLNDLELKSRNLSISIESFNLLEQDFKNFLKILDDLQIEINKSQSTSLKLSKYNEVFQTKQLSLQDLDRKLQMTSRQIENNNNKLSRLKQTNEDKRLNFNKNLEILHQKYTTLITERDLNEQDLLSKKKQILTLENKINELKFQYNDEIKDLNHEILKLNNHIKLYLSEMERKI